MSLDESNAITMVYKFFFPIDIVHTFETRLKNRYRVSAETTTISSSLNTPIRFL